MTHFKNFLNQDEGVTAIEYGLIAALVAVFLITVLTNLGTGLQGTFQSVIDQMPAGGGGA